MGVRLPRLKSALFDFSFGASSKLQKKPSVVHKRPQMLLFSSSLYPLARGHVPVKHPLDSVNVRHTSANIRGGISQDQPITTLHSSFYIM